MSRRASWVVGVVLLAWHSSAGAEGFFAVAAHVDKYVDQDSNLQSLGPGVGLRAGIGTPRIQGMLDFDWIRPLVGGGCDVCVQVWHARILASARVAWRVGPITTLTAKLGAGIDIDRMVSDYNGLTTSDTGPAAAATAGIWFDVADSTRFGIELGPRFEHHVTSYRPFGNTVDVMLSFVLELGV